MRIVSSRVIYLVPVTGLDALRALGAQARRRRSRFSVGVTDTKKESSPKGLLSFLVPVTGLEPERGYPQGILSPWCLPFHHTGKYLNNVPLVQAKVKRTASAVRLLFDFTLR